MQSVYDRVARESMGTLSIFIPFIRLPPEVQNIIWQTAIDSVRPRTVEVKENFAPSLRSRKSKYSGRKQFISTCPIPGVLHACRASRSLALRRWRLSFAVRYQEPKIFFDFEEDVLYFGRNSESIRKFARAVAFEDRQATQILAFHLMRQWMHDYLDDGEDLSLALRRDFPNVKVVLFPEYDAHQMAETTFQLRRRSGRLAKPEPPTTKCDPRKTVIRFIKTERDTDLIDITTEIIVECFRACQERGWAPFAMLRVDYYRTDLSEYEYNHDQRNLETVLFRRYRTEMLEKRKKKSRCRLDSHTSDFDIQHGSASAEGNVMETKTKIPSPGLL